MIKSIKTLKKYFKATKNVFLNKKILMMTKKVYSYDKPFVPNQNFTTEHVKNVQNYRLYMPKF